MQKHNINLKKEIYKDAPAGTKDKRAWQMDRRLEQKIEMPQWK
jgi:hypothetical protein